MGSSLLREESVISSRFFSPFFMQLAGEWSTEKYQKGIFANMTSVHRLGLAPLLLLLGVWRVHRHQCDQVIWVKVVQLCKTYPKVVRRVVVWVPIVDGLNNTFLTKSKAPASVKTLPNLGLKVRKTAQTVNKSLNLVTLLGGLILLVKTCPSRPEKSILAINGWFALVVVRKSA